MFPYFLLLFIPSFFAIANAHRPAWPLWILTFIYFWVFVGLRFEVGPDWIQYAYIHSTIAYYNFWDVALQVEPLSYVLFWISENSGLHTYFSNVVAAFILLLGVFSFARRTPNPWTAIVAATPYFIIVMGMSGVRQSMAAGTILFLFSQWERFNFLVRGVHILIAAMFHTSALVNNIFLVIKLHIRLRYKILLGIFVAGGTLYLSTGVSVYADNILKYQQRYFDNPFLDQSFGSLYHISMVAIPAVLGFIFKDRIRRNVYNLSLLDFGLYASLGVFVLNFFSSTVASRLTVYLYFLPMLIYPALVNTMDRRARLVNTSLVIFFHGLIMLSWFMLGNHAFAYMPYKNVLFDG